MSSLISYLPERLQGLDELALDLRWSWSHDLDKLWRRIDPAPWARTRDPWLVVRSAGRSTLDILASDEAFTTALHDSMAERSHRSATPRWFQRAHPEARLGAVAYFSMEYGISEALPIYAGGLGVLAGDYLKAADDLGVPLVAVGLLYQQGYFRQVIDPNGCQREYYPISDPNEMPILRVRDREGSPLRLSVPFPGREVLLRVWQARVGRISLYLLDTNDSENTPPDRGITSELYGGGPELRLQQELILGIGGWRLLVALGIDPDLAHLNEGHAAFVLLERARSLMERDRIPFEIAFTAARPGTIFTTHTSVAAGFDRFEPRLIEQHVGRYAAENLEISMERLLALGQGPGDDAFMPARLALRGSGVVNAVSRRHGEVSRELFTSLFPRWPLDEVPIGYVTNGVHTPSWDSADADRVWTEACGKHRWREDLSCIDRELAAAPPDDLWDMRIRNRSRLIDSVRERLAAQLRQSGIPNAEVALGVLDPKVLTIGFARRFASYKRPLLLLHDEARLIRLLTDSDRPIQIIVAGKAHPSDDEGKAMVRAWAQFVRRNDVSHRAVFLSDYDLLLAKDLVQGVDLWINTPRPPWEASGTSGMKVLVNGGLNFSELDGWWPEAYEPRFGWALDAKTDERLEREIIPSFYERDGNDIPTAWVDRMRASMAELAPRFSTNRMLREYVEDYYLAASDAYRRRTENQCGLAREIVDWQRFLREGWSKLRFEPPQIESTDGSHRYQVRLHLTPIKPADVIVELYADARGEASTEHHPLELTQVLDDGSGLYATRLVTSRPVSEYTLRAIPRRSDAIIPLETTEILWQHSEIEAF